MPVYQGRSPGAQPCPRCGRPVGTHPFGTFKLQARHKGKDGRWCKAKREPGTGRVLTRPA